MFDGQCGLLEASLAAALADADWLAANWLGSLCSFGLADPEGARRLSAAMGSMDGLAFRLGEAALMCSAGFAVDSRPPEVRVFWRGARPCCRFSSGVPKMLKLSCLALVRRLSQEVPSAWSPAGASRWLEQCSLLHIPLAQAIAANWRAAAPLLMAVHEASQLGLSAALRSEEERCQKAL